MYKIILMLFNFIPSVWQVTSHKHKCGSMGWIWQFGPNCFIFTFKYYWAFSLCAIWFMSQTHNMSSCRRPKTKFKLPYCLFSKGRDIKIKGILEFKIELLIHLDIFCNHCNIIKNYVDVSCRSEEKNLSVIYDFKKL